MDIKAASTKGGSVPLIVTCGDQGFLSGGGGGGEGTERGGTPIFFLD
jgi:hypothetical protein